jgi:ubiquinone/menaquinone biosynthesis C-methylase UbiE
MTAEDESPLEDVADPELVAREYADERRLAVRRRVWNEFLEGPSSDEVCYEAVAEAWPRDVLEVGAGWGEMAARIRDGLGASVVATDRSARMARLARGRELTVLVADASASPFRDRSFDAAVANAMLYHVPDLDRAVGELARVLRDDGRLVATTFGRGHLREVWDLVGGPDVGLSFRAENGADVLRRSFANVEHRRASGLVTFPNAREIRTYVASTITRSHLADRVPELDGPFAARSDFAVFVATQPIR